MDTDGDGKITVDAFLKCLTGGVQRNGGAEKPRIVSNSQELRRMADEIDVNRDSVIDWDEFLAYMRS